MPKTIFCLFIFLYFCFCTCRGINPPPEVRLREYLTNLTEWPVRPVKHHSDHLLILLRFSLTSIVDLNLKEQILTLKAVIELEWTHYKLQWDPAQFEGVTQTPFPMTNLWVPDLTFYNSYGPFILNGEIATLHYNGLIQWKSQTALQNYCEILVIYYPFDVQSCLLVFGAWVHDASEIWFTYKDLPEYERYNTSAVLPMGMNLEDFYPSNEWDVISIPGKLLNVKYKKYLEPYSRIAIEITLRRHWKFYLLNLIIPLMILSYLTLLVFYLPAESGEKNTLCMCLLTSQIMYLVLMIDNIPVTSLAVPLLGKIIIFNLSVLFLSVLCSTLVLNAHCTSPTSRELPKWVRNLRKCKIPLKILWLDKWGSFDSGKVKPMRWYKGFDISSLCTKSLQELTSQPDQYPWHVHKAFQNIQRIQNFIKNDQEMNEERENWKFLAAVIDRVFLIIFNITFLVVTVILLHDAPALYDKREPVR